MPDNQIPAAQPNSEAESAEFNFGKPAVNPRMKRRSLKAKPADMIKPPDGTVSAARELEREAPPLASEPRPAASSPAQVQSKSIPVVVKASETPAAPPRTPPAQSAVAAKPATSATTKPVTSSTTSQTTSPHGTRPATLYYSSYPRKEKETPSPMKSIPSANPTPSPSSTAGSSATRPAATSASNIPSSAARASTAAPSRPAPTIDYRANVERQSREQKSVGNILAYFVYGLIAVFVICAGLAGYGAKVIFDRLHDQSTTVADLDQRYSDANKELNAKLAVTQDTLSQAQAQINRQQDLIVRQQEEINHLIAAQNDEVTALKSEKSTRAQETAVLRSRVRDLETREINQR